MTSRRAVVVDTDTGIDDALTLVYLAAVGGVDLVAITATHGNCSTADSAVNVGHVLGLCGLPDVPIHLGRPGPISGKPPRYSYHVHGHDGLGDLGVEKLPSTPSAEPAAEALVRIGREQPGEVDLLVLGAMSNLADAIAIDPLVLTRYRSIVVMGGSGPYQPAGTILEVDANVDADPQAAEIVFGAEHGNLVMVGVNVTTPAILDEQFLAAVAEQNGPVTSFCTAILSYYLDFYQEKWGRRICSAHDPLAAAILVHPSLVTRAADGPVNVRDDGYAVRARLMRTADLELPAFPLIETPDTHVVLDVDQAAFLTEFTAVLANADARLAAQ
ncbi:nucleoside hydrolase [Cryptosporangium aurantiacum]|uniref:Purine nucleosidase n=1 Tax=Cryptosporangium aurantiacum TaxID=134849 RepID=A0A1M7KBW8_9ACTN|nr:nucleoside hydrolase [Cryptosporangium aurantiacum]SHM62746.1 purine nucleosidase [Cryptosporangium aurantiacum]